MRIERLDRIEHFIYDNQTVTLDMLCEAFCVSKNTIRRDINEIVKSGRIEKIYGGVRVVKGGYPLQSFTDRHITRLAIKKEIARLACNLVNDGDIIFIDSGTTTCHMVSFLSEKKVTVLTNNVEFIVQAIPHPNITLVSLTGELNRTTLSFAGVYTAEALKGYNISKAFMAATGMNVQAGISNTVPSETMVKRMALARSNKMVLLLDSSKFNAVSMMHFASLRDVAVLITDEMPDGELLMALQEAHVSIHVINHA